MIIKELSKKYKDYVINIRRELHKNPGLSWEEYEASATIKRELDLMNISYKECAKTGIIVDIKGTQEKPCILLRADMDALPVEENTEVDYISCKKGIMHACGHDGHIAQLLGAIKILNECRNEIKGTVRCIFQPAEEIGQGANKMIEEGVLKNVDGAFAIHLWADIPVGKISVEEGPRMASADVFQIKISGKGGHGSLPQQCVDPILVASSFVLNLQSIVSREIDPNNSVVITIGKLQAGTMPNVIPENAILEGTTRCFSQKIREEVPRKLERILKGTTELYRASYELNYNFYPAPVINDKICSKIAQGTVIKLFGKECLYPFPKLTTAEDFSAYSAKVPGVLAFVGIRNLEKQCSYPHHHSKFNMDEDGLELGTALYAQYAIDFLEQYNKR